MGARISKITITFSKNENKNVGSYLSRLIKMTAENSYETKNTLHIYLERDSIDLHNLILDCLAETQNEYIDRYKREYDGINLSYELLKGSYSFIAAGDDYYRLYKITIYYSRYNRSSRPQIEATTIDPPVYASVKSALLKSV